MYKIMPYKLENQFCDLLKSDEMLYPGIKAASNFPDIDTCPWLQGLKF